MKRGNQVNYPTQLTLALARKYPDLAEEYPVIDRACSCCETDYAWEG
jgi:hypothetical protein